MIEEEPSTGQPSRGDLGESNLYVNAQATGVHAGKNTAHAVFFFEPARAHPQNTRARYLIRGQTRRGWKEDFTIIAQLFSARSLLHFHFFYYICLFFLYI